MSGFFFPNYFKHLGNHFVLYSVEADLCVCPGFDGYTITGADTQVGLYAR